MPADNHTTIVGNLVEDPELRFTNNGIAVANLRVAVTQRFQQDGEWRDGDTSFLKVNIWRGQAEHLADSLAKGDRVMVTGRLRQRSWETPEGEKRSVAEIRPTRWGQPQVRHRQGRTHFPARQRRAVQRSRAPGRARRRLQRRTSDLLNAGRSPGLQPWGSRVPAGRSTNAAAAFGLAREWLCGPAGT
jgi:single stranded DNA-binding protein